MAYIGNAPGSIRQGRRAVYEFTSTANQTAFSGVDDNGLTLDLLQANDNDVYLNGVRLIITDDYTISGDILTLVSGAAAGDKLIVMTQDEIANDASYSKAASDSRYINYDGDIVNGTIQMGGSGNNITFADNNKAVFGTGSDLEIYSDGTTGQLAGNINVTGTVTADGLSVDSGSITIATSGTNTLTSNGTLRFDIDHDNNATDNRYHFTKNAGAGTVLEAREDGDVKFFDASGTNAKFYWDASAESLGIGTNSPFTKLHAKDTSWSSGSPYGSVALIEGNNVIDNNWGHLVITDTATSNGNGGSIRFATGAANALNPFSGIQGTAEGASWGGIGFETRPQSGTATRRMTIDSTGNVGVGTSAPATKLEVAGTTKAEQYLLDAVAKDISDTAVDVFIYDTRKDSDGGAWRKRTQHTSWYNETLNTATRGSRKEFPAVAVIVAETSQITIYDGDDPDMPMWMVFNDASNYFLNQPTVSAVTMLNGKLAVTGTASNNTSLAIGDFVSEFCQIIRSNYDGDATGLVNRNQSFWSSDKGNTRIIANVVNDVAMTVLPNAPIDAATGLPVPTIAVATNGGVSIIKDDGTVANKVTTDVATISATVDFTKDGYLIVTRNNYSYFVITYLTAASSSHPSGWPYLNYFRSNGVAFPGPNGPVNNPHGNQQYGLANRAISLDNNAASADIYGLNVFDINGGLSSPNNSVAYITSDYNTGWMSGDTKLATLSDTSTTFDTTELVTNGTFSSNITGWTASGSNNISWSSGTISVARNGSTAYGAYQAISTVAGKQYQATFDVPVAGSTTVARLYVGSTAESDNLAILGPSSNGTTGTNFGGGFTAIGSTTYIHLGAAGTTAGTASFDNVSVTLAEQDRSVNGNSLQVFGNGITRTPVATGADLVAYSGFTLASYLVQPATSTMINWSNPWISYFWFDTTGKISIENQNSSGYNNTILLVSANATTINTRSKVSGGAWDQGISIANNGWTHVACVYTGSALEVYRNGIKMATYSGTLTNQTAYISYGVNSYNGAAFPSSWTADTKLALHRISATVPSPEQIKKIYNDEKHLFQENAKATLYGSSDAVTALAYDDDTELLHVGTSAGRSVFQGLRRIDNTTDAVGAAISASNGMVAED